MISKHINHRMNLQLKWLVLSFIAVAVTVSCIYDFTPTGIESKENIIVIEGDIIAGSISKFKISTTIKLSTENNDIKYITNATIWVEGEDGQIINAQLTSNSKESFIANTSDINLDKKYRLCVDIPNRGSYRSKFIPVLQTPLIDSLSYFIGENENFVQFEVSTHSNNIENKYYRWLFDEDWEFHSNHIPILMYNEKEDIAQEIPRDQYAKNYYCWNKDFSSAIYVASTDKLSQNVVYKQPINRIYDNDIKISYIYSILVSQISLSKEGYLYWETLRKNTDETGGIFAPQPSEMKGNIESVTNPQEPVIGYISASTSSQSRLFVYNSNIRVYKEPAKCSQDTLKHFNSSTNLWRNSFLHGMLMLNHPEDSFGVDKSLAIWLPARCIDCEKAGGTKNKPSFWPNDHK